MPEFRKPTPRDWGKMVAVVSVAVGIPILVAARFWPSERLMAVVVVGCAVAGLAILVRWHAATTGYCCANCGREFQLTAWQDFFSPNLIDSKYARCPHCRRWGSHAALVRVGRA